MTNYKELDNREQGGGLVKMWTKYVPVESGAIDQLKRTASLDVVHPHLAAMPDVHYGRGATIGSVVPTKNAIIPACVGVDLGCGMAAMRTSMTASDLPDNLKPMRMEIERAVPHGRSKGGKDKGSWAGGGLPNSVAKAWRGLDDEFREICSKYKHLEKTNNSIHLGTLGGGNHFIEICLDEEQRVWVMLHSGSRGVGNAIGRTFIEKAQKECEKGNVRLPDRDLAYLHEGTELFDDYFKALFWAQKFARVNRDMMMIRVLDALRRMPDVPGFKTEKSAVNCHHNYVSVENHFGEELMITRKGAIKAGLGDLGIIPGSMGAKSFIVRGKGNEESFNSCSHGAGRIMSRSRAKREITLDDHIKATEGVECRKEEGIIDESPGAYKNILDVMRSQEDLVDIVHTLKQVICVKG
jgi:tRNA-splicing ligase RtcB